MNRRQLKVYKPFVLLFKLFSAIRVTFGKSELLFVYLSGKER